MLNGRVILIVCTLMTLQNQSPDGCNLRFAPSQVAFFVLTRTCSAFAKACDCMLYLVCDVCCSALRRMFRKHCGPAFVDEVPLVAADGATILHRACAVTGLASGQMLGAE